MAEEVTIRYNSNDHAEFCGRCEKRMENPWWMCYAAGGKLCGQIHRCPLHKWKRG